LARIEAARPLWQGPPVDGATPLVDASIFRDRWTTCPDLRQTPNPKRTQGVGRPWQRVDATRIGVSIAEGACFARSFESALPDLGRCG
jgi:hypothetical protein